MTTSKTDIPLYRTFAIRLIDRVVEEMRTMAESPAPFPNRTICIDEDRHNEHSIVTAKIRNSNSAYVELTIYTMPLGGTISATFHGTAFLKAGDHQQLQGFANENEGGDLRVTGLYLTRQPAA